MARTGARRTGTRRRPAQAARHLRPAGCRGRPAPWSREPDIARPTRAGAMRSEHAATPSLPQPQSAPAQLGLELRDVQRGDVVTARGEPEPGRERVAEQVGEWARRGEDGHTWPP